MNVKRLPQMLLITVLLMILALPLTVAADGESITGTQDDTSGVWLFSAGLSAGDCQNPTGTPAGAPTDDIISAAIAHSDFEFLGDIADEVVTAEKGSGDEGDLDYDISEIYVALADIDDFGYIGEGSDDDDAANFDMGRTTTADGPGFVELKWADDGMFIVADGVAASGTIGPDGATDENSAKTALQGFEIFIFEDAELSGMIVTLSNKNGLSIDIVIADRQVNPHTETGADDTMIAIDLDTLAGFDGTYIDRIRIQDDGQFMSDYPCPRKGDTSVELDAVVTTATSVVTTGSVGDRVWIDLNGDGVQDAGEPGIGGVELELWKDGSPTGQTTTTAGDGTYIFDNLAIDLDGETYTVIVSSSNFDSGGPLYAMTQTFDNSGALDNTSVSVPLTIGGTEFDVTLDFGYWIDPEAVELASFSATPGDGSVLIAWETGSEINNLGFNIYRGTEDQIESATMINDQLIPSKAFGSVSGATYEYLDTGIEPGVFYHYWLEDVESVGNAQSAAYMMGIHYIGQARGYNPLNTKGISGLDDIGRGKLR